MQLQNGRYLSLSQRFSPHYDERPYDLVDLLVLHNISLPMGRFGTGCVDDLFMGCLDTSTDDSFHELEGLKVAPHFFIDREGCIVQYVATHLGAWHAGQSVFNGQSNCNDFSLGIEIEGTDHTAYTEAQYDALVALTRAILSDFPLITLDRIVGHSDIAPDRKTDPGPSFDWQRFRDNL